MSQSESFASSFACCLPRMPQPMMATVILSLALTARGSAAVTGAGIDAVAAAAVARIESSRNFRRVMFDIGVRDSVTEKQTWLVQKDSDSRGVCSRMVAADV